MSGRVRQSKIYESNRYTPEGYVRLNFTADENGSLTGTTIYDVKVGTDASEVTVPTPVANANYKFDAWTPALPVGAFALLT